jgi:hypothetical protein
MCDSHHKLRCVYHDILIICASQRLPAVTAHLYGHLPTKGTLQQIRAFTVLVHQRIQI